MKKYLLIYFFICCGFMLAQSTVVFVNFAASGNNDGSSWANAYTSFQSALNNVSSGDQIWVAKGIYKPSYAYDLTNSSRFYHFRMIEGVEIYGGFAGTESSVSERSDFGEGGANETILSGDIGTELVSSDNCYHIFYHPDGTNLTSAAVLNGFTITNANADGIAPHNNGGGIYNYSCSPTLENIAIINNKVDGAGGGIYNYLNCSVSMSNINVSDNTANNGGGIFNSNSLPLLDKVTISGNSASGNGGGIYNSSSSSASLNNVTISGNSATFVGGGVYNSSSSPTVVNSLIFGNSANEAGGMHILSSSPTLINTTITDNTADYGAGIYLFSSSTVELNNCIIWSNTATNNGDEFYIWSSTATLNYSCYANSDGDIYNSGGTVTADNTITNDPQFVDAAGDDYRIKGTSPCCDTGNSSFNSESYDIRGEGFNRKLDKTSGGAGAIDIGAYEYQVSTDPLPVELVSFSAEAINNKVLLKWQTATEVNNYGFEIERSNLSTPFVEEDSLGGESNFWTTIGFINGYGNSNSLKNYEYFDENPNEGSLSYRLKQIDTNGDFNYFREQAEISFNITGCDKDIILSEYSLSQNYPNPFNPTTTIEFDIPESGFVELVVYNLLGERITTLVQKELQSGSYKFTVDANSPGMTSGVYFYRLNTSNGYASVRKMMLTK